jgi:hypothetical protein
MRISFASRRTWPRKYRPGREGPRRIGKLFCWPISSLIRIDSMKKIADLPSSKLITLF